MTNAEHMELADFIKSIHKKLREEATILGIEQAWKKHCENGENLEKYASAMQQLAVNHWDKNSEKNQKVISRIVWVYTACKEYFMNIGRYRDKELDIFKNCLKHNEGVPPLVPTVDLQNSYKLLDVGSCYNPFEQFEIFEVMPIDIAPANKDVLKCDFLKLKICTNTIIKDHTLIELAKDSFDVVVFSLLLEYFPNPEQRLECCLKAYKLLKTEGILVIVTPDSNHVGSNAKIIKSWRYVLAKHGFIRIKYEKLPHMHCMVFRKAHFKLVAQRWAEIHESENLFQEIFIPQDFAKVKQEKSLTNVKTQDNNWHENTFLQDLHCSLCD